VARVFADRTRAELTSAGMAAGVKVTPVLEPAEVLTNEHAASRASGVPFALPGGAQGCLPAGFFSVDGRRAGIRHPARRLDGAAAWPERAETPGNATNEAGESAGTAAAPLAGIRVLDFGIGGVGVEGGRMLAEWGADVIKVESAKRPDFQRMVLGGVMNPTFASSSRSKRGLGVNLATDDGRDLLCRLLPAVDIVVENSATGAMARLGLGYDDLRAVNPRIVMVSSQLMGDRGAWAHWKGYGPSARAAGGLTWLWTHPGRPEPGGVSTIHPDHFAGRLLALGALAGLSARDRTGAGCHVDVAQFEAVMGLLGDLLLAESVAPGSIRPVGNTRAGCAPWGVYRCADDQGSESWIAICVRGDTDWQRLRAAIGDPSWAGVPELDTAAGRCAAREELDERLGEWTAGRDARDVMTVLQTARVPAGVLLHPRTLVDDPHFCARRFVRPIEQPGCGEVLLDGPAFRGAYLGEPRIEPAPLPGQHTREVCRTLLGLDDDEIDGYVAAGVLEEERPAARRAPRVRA
jgi:crotonobetainyl-CoA:carnitine CoA-transferase CaiB-like acyl-CoA transferase